ncbi:MAG: ATP-binding cassette domain-containing protein [Deltaproteobacteria bacterium]|nr:ATP-binding cassette domain-containing protein [Deltaproteobacteria bacterium]
MIQVVELSKGYGTVAAVAGVSFTVPALGTLAVLGPSGSGKTTLLRLLAGLDLPDAGEIYLDGRLASRPGWALEPHRRGLGFLFQTPALWPHLTVAQNILFGLYKSPKKAAQERLEELLEQMSLTALARRYPYQISGGEARRVSLARTLAPRPRLLLLDEPLINLDPELKHHLLQLIKTTVTKSRGTLIYVTHDRQEAAAVVEDFLFLDRGRIVQRLEAV